MNYSSSYLSDSVGDYVSVKLGSVAHPTATPTVCKWQVDGTTCNWPVPGADKPENIDDLWHAAVNGRGAYFSATNPSTLSTGLSNALAGINTRKGAAAAAATSTLNPVSDNNAAYVASYTTVEWRGNLESRSINTDTAAVSENATWCVENVPAGTCASTPVAQTTGDTTIYNCETPATVTCVGGELGYTGNTTSGASYCKVPLAMSCTGTMNAKVSDFSDTRVIKTANSTGTTLIDFDATYATANPNYFNAGHIATLSQWTSLSATQQTIAQNNLVNYLRGQYGYEDRTANASPVDNRLFRYRSTVLGDALESQPAYIGKPVFSYTYPGYSELIGDSARLAGGYKTVQASRDGTVYMGANDGMMHAFASDTGVERWAYVPSMVVSNMWKLADKNYATLHLNFVNGSPITSDICVANCTNAATADWRTILVGGLNGGGRGYYALDITIPSTPMLLWEFTTTTGIGKIKDDDVGYSYGQPIITRKADGTWVVLLTSGYNNTSPGDGKAYLYTLNASTGAIISKIATGVGSTATPSGLAKISGWNNEPAGNAVGYVYGGDLLGNVWRFNINGTNTAVTGTGDVMKLASLYSDVAGGNPQPITTTPVLGKISGKRVVFVGTGKYLETADLTTTQQQTQYAIKDDDATATLVNPRNSLVQQTLTNNSDGTATRVSSNNTVNFYTDRGWYVDFPEGGERINIDSSLVQGVLVVPSIVPSNTACSPGGHGWLNFFNYKTGGAIDTNTMLASVKYDSTIVGINIVYIGGQPKVAVVTSTDPTPRVDDNVTFPVSAASFTGKRSLWRELIP
jgi:type IV pilus assembly protein PilY1